MFRNLAHNEKRSDGVAWRHLFFPGALSLVLEGLVAIVLLVALNFVAIENTLLKGHPEGLNFADYTSNLLDSVLGYFNQFHFVGQIMVFGLWASVTMLAYIGIFRVLQAFFGASESLHMGYRFVKIGHRRGLLYWIHTMHNFFVKILFDIVSVLLFGAAILVAFAWAAQQVQLGLQAAWPDNVLPLAYGFLATFLGVRLMVMGICLLIPRFGRWYLL